MENENPGTNESAGEVAVALDESPVRGGWFNILPALKWLHGYQLSWVRLDVAAGVTLAAYLLLAGLADASLANLPPEAWLYACLFGGLVFWLFVEARASVRDRLHAEGVDDKVGRIGRFRSLADAVEDFQKTAI
jgi:MFS superfamily sulfate permease-like transporter